MSGEASPVVLCVGRVYCDLVFTDVPRLPTLGTETFGGGLGLHAGGGAFITAAAFSALGMRAALCAMLPAPPFDDIVAKGIAASDIDASLCQPATGDAPQITVAVATREDRAFLSHRIGPAMPGIDFQNLPRTLTHLHIGELRTLAEQPDLIARGQAAGLTVSLDCSWDDALLSTAGDLATLIAGADIFLPNEAEHARLLDLGLPENPARLTVVKCGDKGARAFHRDGWVQAQAPRVEVVDATGAGDAFNGGFITDWLAGQPLQACLETGNACGSLAVQAAGGTGGFANLQRPQPTAAQ